MTQSARISYIIMAVLLVMIGWLHMATLLLTTLFGYFASACSASAAARSSAWPSYVVVVTGIAYGLYLAMWVFKLDAGNPKMQEIGKAIQVGAGAYMNRPSCASWR